MWASHPAEPYCSLSAILGRSEITIAEVWDGKDSRKTKTKATSRRRISDKRKSDRDRQAITSKSRVSYINHVLRCQVSQGIKNNNLLAPDRVHSFSSSMITNDFSFYLANMLAPLFHIKTLSARRVNSIFSQSKNGGFLQIRCHTWAFYQSVLGRWCQNLD